MDDFFKAIIFFSFGIFISDFISEKPSGFVCSKYEFVGETPERREMCTVYTREAENDEK